MIDPQQKSQLIETLAVYRQYARAVYRGAILGDIKALNKPAAELLLSREDIGEPERWKLLFDLAQMGEKAKRRMDLSSQLFDETTKAAAALNAGEVEKAGSSVATIAATVDLITKNLDEVAVAEVIWDAGTC